MVLASVPYFSSLTGLRYGINTVLIKHLEPLNHNEKQNKNLWVEITELVHNDYVSFESLRLQDIQLLSLKL